MSDELDKVDDTPSMISEMLGDGPTILGREVRPVTLASIALLERIGSPLIAGKNIEHTPEITLECMKFLLLQTGELEDARQYSLDLAKLDIAALDLADSINPSEAEDVLNQVVSLLQDSMSTQVEPHVEDEDRQVDDSEGNV